ncbi:MAG: glycosyltransferase [Nitrospirota bacterium]|nr:glycosyltransferase [Nitrospirota bacterium]
MKIALVIKEFDPHKGGAERYACLLAKGLADRKHRVHVFANQWEAIDPRLTFHHVPMVRWNSLLKVISFPMNAHFLLMEEEFDIVHGLAPLWEQDVYRIGEGLHVDALRLRYPSLAARFMRYLNPKHLAILWLERMMFRPGHCRKVITNSRMCGNRVQELYGVPECDVEVAYNGVDTAVCNPRARDRYREEARRELAFSGTDVVLLFVSMDFVRKGLPFLLEAHGRLKAEGVALKTLVVGKGRVDEFKALAERLGIGGEVTFVAPTKEPQRYYAAGDCLVLPTLYDPFSNVCLEAMACGLPVITTRQNGASELIDEGENGCVIDEGRDVESLCAAITRCLPADNLRQMGARAAEKARRYTVERNVEQVEALYEELLASGDSGVSVTELNGILVNSEFLPLLEKNGLSSYDALMAAQGDAFKDISHRSVTRISVQEKSGTRTLYLKRHREKGVSTDDSGGMAEWELINRFWQHGIPTMVPVAAGARTKGAETESLLVTDALEGFQRMEIFMRDRYVRPLSNKLVGEKRELVRLAAELTRKMHREGFNHRDFYLTHIMVKPLGYGDFDLRIIDLQRVQERRWFRHRWLVKDLASLNFAAKDSYTTRTDRLRFYLAYTGKKRLDKGDRAFIRAILAKTQRISDHDASATARKLEYAAKANRSATP